MSNCKGKKTKIEPFKIRNLLRTEIYMNKRITKDIDLFIHDGFVVAGLRLLFSWPILASPFVGSSLRAQEGFEEKRVNIVNHLGSIL